MIPAIEVRHLNYAYPDGSEALHDVTFAVQANECVGLIGPNGSGKSTLLMHLNGLLPATFPTQASVTIAGMPVDPGTISTVRRRVGLLFQNPDDQLFSPTVFEDIAFGPRQFQSSESDVRRRVEKALHDVGMDSFADRAPHRLSEGEKKRICLAGVLACVPDILVLDEPTAELDPRGRRQFRQLLGSLQKTTIIASHDLDLVAGLCSRSIVLDGGRIVADGPSMELLADEALMLKHGLETPCALRQRRRE